MAVLEPFLKQLKQSGSIMFSLLRPAYSNCRLCGRSMKPIVRAETYADASYARYQLPIIPELCESCNRSIAWIKDVRCLICGRAVHCDDCIRRVDAGFIWNRSAVRYDSVMRSWLANYKYQGQEHLEPLLIDMLEPMFKQMTTELISRLNIKVKPRRYKYMPDILTGFDQMKHHAAACWDIVTYVPISEERASERGFNQAQRLAAGLARRYGLPIASLLLRTRHTTRQSFKTRLERLRDTRMLFTAEPAAAALLTSIYTDKYSHASTFFTLEKQPLRVLLVDDIYTTGSTANSCAITLHACSGITLELYVLTWARS
ncbi:ComF family protein [Paenibacillus abyssi]|uniref:Amidophosphoribosyltransferase n=1 Tax=Paenibacillus abyssi TaxID=1340531 RepID=A0A917CMZ9_9BACL|nr:ComF family protein [Paenibacillus abyssi]GGF91584.1 amidophosphoribosyltransferase [Paenibacillus abyssi]